nr:hypothetical protein [Thermococcus sp. Bubb.Bath]
MSTWKKLREGFKSSPLGVHQAPHKEHRLGFSVVDEEDERGFASKTLGFSPEGGAAADITTAVAAAASVPFSATLMKLLWTTWLTARGSSETPERSASVKALFIPCP